MLAMLLGVADIGHAAAPLLADDDGLGQLTLLADPSDGGSVSGGGAYATGQTVNLRASAATGFVFTGWTRADGTEVSNTANFAYTKQEGDEVLIAHFRYDPGNPNDPVTPVFPEKKPTHSVSVSAVPADGGSVSVEKNVVEEGTQTRVRASAASSFQFLGWYVADTLYSKSADFYYTMGEENIHFEARFQYNPGSPNDPPQPDIPFITPDYNVSVTVSPADGGSANTERSSLKEGEQTRLRASAAAGFRFTGWYVADTLYNTVADFYYTMGQADILFEARFRYDPGSPNEPPQPDLPVIKPKHQVTAEAVPADGGSVSVGTGTVEEGQSTRLSASGASGFVFLGWYANDSLYSQSANYDYTMEQSDIHFEARFQYNPGSPNEPSSPDTHRYELYLTTMRGMPGRTIQYPVYLNALDTLKDMHFQLNFPEGTIPDMENIRLSGKAVGYTLTYEKVEAAAEVRNFGPLRAGEDKKLISYAMHLIGGTTPPCNTRLLTINLSLGEDFSGNETQQVSVNQISMTDVEGNTETASARHGSLIMREASELGNIFYLTINATGFGSARVGSKHIRNSVQVIDFVENSSANVYFVPDDGYHLEQVLIGEEDVTSQVVENRLFIASIQDDINLEVTFAEGASASNPLTVTATGNGVVTYIDSAVRDSEQTFDVSYGSEVVLNLTPDKGHHLANVTVNEENAMEQVADGHLTIESMTAASTIAATFEPNLHTVTFAYADTVYSQLEVAYGEAIAVPENPVLRGHTFAGWTPDVPPAMPDSSMTFTAKFTVNQYTAIFSIPSEDWEEVLTLDYGSTITPPTPPTKPGYTFVGWDKEIPATMPDSAIVLIGSYTQNMVKLSLTASGQGTIVFGDENVRNETKVFEVAELSAVELTIREDLGSLLERVSVNEEDRTAELDDNKTLRLGSISEDTNVEVLFIEQSTSFTLDGLQYIIPDVRMGEIVLIGAEDMEHITIPNEVEYGGKQWAVTAIADSCFDENPSLISIRIPVSIESVGANLFKGCMHLAAINWEAKSHLTSTMMGTLSNPNLLLYIDRTDKAPVEINNVINLQSLTAERITLSDANVPGDFYCPTAFIAKEISYSHEYLQQTLSDKCQGWESIVLPFDVQIIKHEKQGEIHPFATLLDEQIVDGDRPFWLYRFTEEGHFKEADGIRANEPYILSMPNEPELWDIYKLNGRVTFSAANVMVEPTTDVVEISSVERTFLPCYRHEAENTEWYLLNVGDAYDGHAEGGVFSAERPGRSAHPFEAYFEATGSSPVKGYYEIFEKENMNSVHSVQDIERNGDGAVYGIGGEKISNLHTSFSTLRLKRGLYIMPPTAGKKGRKVVVK